jgi:hypothetical protein
LQPLPFSAFGSIPSMTAATYQPAAWTSTGYNAAQFSPTDVSTQGSFLDPNQSDKYLQQNEAAVQAALAPQFKSQDQQLAESLAAKGLLSSGAAVQAQNDLFGQQAAATAQGDIPLISQGYGYSQADLVNNANVNQNVNAADAAYANQAAAANASAVNQSQAFDATAANEAASQNAAAENTAGASNAASTNAINEANSANYLNVVQGDANAYNAFLSELLGLGSSYGTGLVSSEIGSFQPANPAVLNTLGLGASNATTAGNNAFNSTANATGGAGQAFSDVFSGLVNNATRTAPEKPNTQIFNV